MKIVIFGLSVSSSWGNGHATLWRGLFRALEKQGCDIHFFEKDTPYYAAHRDAPEVAGAHLHLYADWNTVRSAAAECLSGADVGIVTSYCPDGPQASDLVLQSNLYRSVFYDLDAPVTLERIDRGESVEYLPRGGFEGFDLVLSYAGGPCLAELQTKLKARRVAPLYGSVDPEIHHPVAPRSEFSCDFSYLGTYSADRQQKLQELFLRPAAELDGQQFLIAGAMYPQSVSQSANVRLLEHVSPSDHSAFYCSSRLTLSITRASMARLGYCPSGRLFEAAACGTAVLSDYWPGLEMFFTPGEQILLGESAADAKCALQRTQTEIAQIARRARERALDCHTASHRATELLAMLSSYPKFQQGLNSVALSAGEL
jgi:spore maturation protein CgeB